MEKNTADAFRMRNLGEFQNMVKLFQMCLNRPPCKILSCRVVKNSRHNSVWWKVQQMSNNTD